MRVTVFGGSGFLGSHVCDKLSQAGHEVVIFDLKESPWRSDNQIMVLGDILDSNAVSKVVNGSDIIFNFAGIADIDETIDKPAETVMSNILGNVHILEACRKNNIKRYIYASTVYVYSRSGGFYRCSKQASELYIENYHQQYGLEYTILRYGSLYGPRADNKNAIHNFISQVFEKNKVIYDGNPDALREYIHVEDAAQASIEILKPEYTNENVTLAGHHLMRVSDLLHMIQEIFGKDIAFEFKHKTDSGHYDITPYSYTPKIGKKYAAPLHIDMGQGLLQIIEEYSNNIKT